LKDDLVRRERLNKLNQHIKDLRDKEGT